MIAAVSWTLLCAEAAQASELVYTPINPSFGGNPLNGPTLLNEAQVQNHFKEPTTASPLSQQSALQQFNSALRNAILSRISSAVTSDIVGTNGQLIPGTVETSDFRIAIVSLGDGVLQITTTDKTTGQSTQFQVTQP